MKNRLVLLVAALCFAAAPGFAGENWNHITKEDGLPDNEIQLIMQDRQGTLWIGTSSGLAKRAGNKFKVFLEGKNIFDFNQIGSKKYLVGTGGGIFLLNGKEEKQLFEGNQIAPIVHYKNNVYWALGKDPNTKTNNLWQGTPDGDWKKVEAFENRKVSDLFRDDGTVWVVQTGDGVHAINPKKGPEEAAHHLPGFNINVISRDRDGNIWCGGMAHGVRQYADDSWSSYMQDEDTVIFDIEEDTNGHVWVATNTIGVWAYDGEEWKQHLDGQINMLETTSDGRVWVSSQMKGGLRTWDGSEWQTTLESRLPFRTLYESKDGKIWAGSVLGGVYWTK